MFQAPPPVLGVGVSYKRRTQRVRRVAGQGCDETSQCGASVRVCLGAYRGWGRRAYLGSERGNTQWITPLFVLRVFGASCS